ncbi:MAG TPA: hypothetical protein ENI95_00870, partial [Chloroflexi bacterium]|nr:hypothetical protein [Chloroflexota bacterium]
MIHVRRRITRDWLFPVALAVFIGASVALPLLLWLLPQNPYMGLLGAVVGAAGGLIGGQELWDRMFAGKRRRPERPARGRTRAE